MKKLKDGNENSKKGENREEIYFFINSICRRSYKNLLSFDFVMMRKHQPDFVKMYI